MVLRIVLECYGITQEEFSHLRFKKVSALSDSEKDLMKGIQETVPKLDENMYLQKTIPIKEVDRGVYEGWLSKDEVRLVEEREDMTRQFGVIKRSTDADSCLTKEQ